MTTSPRTRRALIATAAIAAVVSLAGVASASIPGSNGTITGCFTTNHGTLRLIDRATTICGQKERQITWNRTGPAGPVGPAGPAGPTGPGGGLSCADELRISEAAPGFELSPSCETDGGAGEPGAPTAVVGLTVDPETVRVGGTATGTLTLSQTVTTETVVSLSATDPAVLTVPSVTAVGVGSTHAAFSLTGLAAGRTHLTAALGGSSRTVEVVVTSSVP